MRLDEERRTGKLGGGLSRAITNNASFAPRREGERKWKGEGGAFCHNI